ncbi:hypothetical protein OKA05_25470 [Luteolibacter arcticus]|uniref:CBM-cenC domain-containing protein n=1 Tax=Luteolibacter arcticus TaxID=1581411 RepID=A0ABT3GQY9_9BACT|nr:hypothetical protein [Luteolibacter arcticus]MCW1925934.1 hypothetical protein [Luteolibacter arcticus]
MKLRHCILPWVLAAAGAHGAELAHYRFDNGFADASGNGRDGVLTDIATLGNTAIVTTDKVFGAGAIDFSDDRDFIAIPELNFPAGATYTIALWAKRDSGSRTYDVMAGNRFEVSFEWSPGMERTAFCDEFPSAWGRAHFRSGGFGRLPRAM